jgi:formamidopyrimidine-DNA glycosylase
MPELPEVETIAVNLRLGRSGNPSLVGRRILAAEILWPRSLAEPDPENFFLRIAGQTIQDIGRRGKYLVFYLSSDTLLVHLRMSGDIWVEAESVPVAAHHRMLFHLEGDERLVFSDPRKFGRVWLVPDQSSVVAHLGPEPLDEDFTAARLHAMLHSKSKQLKPLLLEQSFIAGLGNIYADEALHLARLHPLTLSDSLTKPQTETLWGSIRYVLYEGIRRNGASIDWVYRGGDFQNYFRAYGRAGLPCPECGVKIERITVGQRGTHYCPQCQPAP